MEEGEQQLVVPRSNTDSMVSVTLGRAMSALLSARPKKLRDAVCRFSPSSRTHSLGSLEESLWFLYKYVQETAERMEQMDQIIIPMVEHSLRSKESKHGGQVLILLSWLFQDEFIFQSLMRDLVNIISRKEDRYIALGWCTLVRELVEYESTMTQYSLSGLREKYSAMIEILCTCISHLSAIVSRGSTVSDGYELPSRLSISAADCCLAITEALTRKDDSLKNKIRISDFNTSKEAVPSLPGIGEKKAKETQTISNRGRETLLWDQLPELINLVQRLLANVLDREKREGIGALVPDSSHHWTLAISSMEVVAGIGATTAIEEVGGVLYARRKPPLWRRFESVMSEYGLQISEVLISQLNSGDEDVIDLVVGIFKGTIFKLNYSSEGILIDTRQMDAVLPLLLQLLDKRDGTARAVVILVAEYCSMSIDGECLKEVLERLACGNNLQQRNALDVISEIIQISLTSADGLPHLAWRDISNYLLGCLESGEPAICRAATNLLPMIEPSYVLPALVRLLYSSDIKLQLSVKDAFIGVLKYHNQEPEVISMLLDSLSNLSNSLDFPKTSGITVEGSKFDADKVLKLMTEWSENVQDWKIMAGPLIDKLFTEPSNAIVVKFLSYISEHLADAADIILNRVLKCMQEQEELVSETSPHEDSEMQKCLFERLCPLLIIRLLPLRVFNSLNSSIVYGQLHNKDINHDGTSTIHDNCVTALLLKRAFSKFEFEDVRKLAAELSGRILPTVLFPLVCFQLEDSAGIRDVSRIKAGLFSLCTSLVVRGRNITVTSTMIRIRKLLEEILSWPSLDGDEVSRAQHGCIDCLALMICTEVQSSSGSFGDSKTLKKKITLAAAEGMTDLESTLSYVISQLDNDDSSSTSFEAPLSLSFRLCMANVLISACQKIADSGKTHLARKTIPALIRSSEVIKDREIRAACLQVLFSAVYHLKSAVIPYSSDLIKLSLKFLREGSEKERMAGAKLLAALMASEDPILESISAGLLDARSILSTLSRTDPSPELRQACQKLLLCLTSS
ncbi:hypothetical protein CDL15_Pgr000675 [Punica granatum]|uniref:Uncharacterized protein n=1 Tax=Punica granatum TaxID=22663 RepID=A0A218W3U8_PUNGR|nr:hypothetical protein CDL15_Pgr000675 [Punica granatum]